MMNSSPSNVHMRDCSIIQWYSIVIPFHPPFQSTVAVFWYYTYKTQCSTCGERSILKSAPLPTPIHLGEVKVLLRDTAPNEWRLGARVVDVLKQNLGGRVGNGHGLGGGHLLIDVRTSLLVDGLELLLGGHRPVENVLLQALNGIVGASHALDLLTGTVRGAGVRHGVTSIPVGDILKNHGAVVGISPLLAVLDSRLDSETVHAVDLETRDVLATLVVVRESGRPVGRCTHTVLVVCNPVSFLSPLFLHIRMSPTLAAKQCRQLPQLCHVKSLKHLSLVAGTITVEDD